MYLGQQGTHFTREDRWFERGAEEAICVKPQTEIYKTLIYKAVLTSVCSHLDNGVVGH